MAQLKQGHSAAAADCTCCSDRRPAFGAHVRRQRREAVQRKRTKLAHEAHPCHRAEQQQVAAGRSRRWRPPPGGNSIFALSVPLQQLQLLLHAVDKPSRFAYRDRPYEIPRVSERRSHFEIPPLLYGFYRPHS